MPCYDDRTSCSDYESCYKSNPAVIQVPVCTDEAKDTINILTRVCCDMRTILRRANLEMALTIESREWIKIHDECDRKRIAEENASGERARVKQEALDKLSLEERRVLGL